MAQLPTSGIRLFRLFGIQVYLHWTWFLVAAIQLRNPITGYSSQAWHVAEYLCLFGIVLMHEFGHALACRSVGGHADRIMLWPLGGVAFVDPPQRPGAVLWSIVAGPLVNVILLPITWGAFFAVPAMGGVSADLLQFLWALAIINTALLVFNMLPIYPLDGGQILRAILWFFMGDRRSLLVASFIGLIGAAGGILVAFSLQSVWLTIMAVFAALQSWAGFQRAKMMNAEMSPVSAHTNLRCPACGSSPPAGAMWVCTCGKPFDVFASRGQCPNCGGLFHAIPCPFCRQASPPAAWQASPPIVITHATSNPQ